MSLTTHDLKAIRKVIREEVKAEVKDSTRTLGNQIRLTKLETKSSISELDDRMKNVEIRIDNGSAKTVKRFGISQEKSDKN